MRGQFYPLLALGNFTTGQRFAVNTYNQPMRCLGVQFWALFNGVGTRSYKCQLWNFDAGTLLATVTVSGVVNSTLVSALFASSVDLTTLNGTSLLVSIYETTGASYVRCSADPAWPIAIPLPLGPEYFWLGEFFIAGDAKPVTATSERYPLNPILAFF